MTHTPPEGVADLIARLEKATGPDREIDAAIFNALPDPEYPQIAYQENNCITLRAIGRDPQFHDGWLVRRSRRADDKYPNDLPRLTASLDAAIALCERVLPGTGWLVGRGRTRPDEPIWGAQIFASENYRVGEVALGEGETSATAALALCLALLRSLPSGEGR